jgi:hypothetical protein
MVSGKEAGTRNGDVVSLRAERGNGEPFWRESTVALVRRPRRGLPQVLPAGLEINQQGQFCRLYKVEIPDGDEWKSWPRSEVARPIN